VTFNKTEHWLIKLSIFLNVNILSRVQIEKKIERLVDPKVKTSLADGVSYRTADPASFYPRVVYLSNTNFSVQEELLTSNGSAYVASHISSRNLLYLSIDLQSNALSEQDLLS
jgi:hypothetical protein